jgi:hypothetical protein
MRTFVAAPFIGFTLDIPVALFHAVITGLVPENHEHLVLSGKEDE